ncbi:MAG: hypothetical protein ACYCW5_05410 [Thermoleophilia bacterium]
MMLVPHTCVNAAVGRLFKSPVAAFATGVIAHAALDLMPHKDISAHKAEGLLVATMLGIIGTSCGFRSAPFWCAMGGVLPDVEQVLPWTDPKRGRHRWFPTHNRKRHSLQIPGAPDYTVRLLTQSAASMTALMLAVYKCRPSGAS